MIAPIKQLLLLVLCCCFCLTAFTQVTSAAFPSFWAKRTKMKQKRHQAKIATAKTHSKKSISNQRVTSPITTVASITSDLKGTVWINDKSFDIAPSASVEAKVPLEFSYYFISEDKIFISELEEKKVASHEKKDGFPLNLVMKEAYDLQKIEDDRQMKNKLTLGSLKDDMVFIKGGTVRKKRQRKRVIDDFELSPYEVTVGQFALFIADTPSYIPSADSIGYSRIIDVTSDSLPLIKMNGINWKCDPSGELYAKSEYSDYPVVHVSWLDAIAFCEWLGRKNPLYEYRLPTATEWNLAAKSGHADYQYAWGNEGDYFPLNANIADKIFQDAQSKLPNDSQQEDGYLLCSPVGTYAPNEYGLYDMTGNVAEWCEDIDTKYTNRRNVYKGGSYAASLKYSKIEQISGHPFNLTHPGIGFRVCRVSKKGYEGTK